METLEQQFNSRVRVFLGRTGLSPTTFGMKALGDPNLMRQIDGGRSLSLRTADRVLAFVADYDLDSGGPRTPPRGHRRPEAFVTGEENEEEQSDDRRATYGRTGVRKRRGGPMRTLALRRCARVLRSKPRHGHVLRLRGRVGQRRTGSTDRDGSDPPVRGPGTGSDAGVFAHLPPPSWGRSRSINPYAGRRFERRFEAADHPFADRPAVWQPGITEQGRGTPDGWGRSPSRQVRDAPIPGDRGATAKQPATYGTAGAHIATAVPCTCTSMSMCTRGTPPTPGDRRSRSAPRAALDTSAKQPAHDSAGLVNREAPARWVIGSERAERRKARRTRNRPSGEDAFSARSFQRADRAVHHRGGIE